MLVLLDAQNAYYIGNLTQALKYLQKAQSLEPEAQIKCNILAYQIYIAQKKYGVVLDEISADTEVMEYKLLRLLSQYFSREIDSASVISKLGFIVSEATFSHNEVVLVLAATLYMNLNMPESALKILSYSNSATCNALTIQCLLSINRSDLAGKIVRRMQTADEDSVPAQLAFALYYLFKSGEQLQEAHHIYQELIEKHGPTSLLLNGQASALIGMNQWEEAESVLQEAIDLDSGEPDTLVNMLMVYQHLNKPVEMINRLMSQLKDCCKDHPFLVEYAAKDDEFTNMAQHYTPSVSS